MTIPGEKTPRSAKGTLLRTLAKVVVTLSLLAAILANLDAGAVLDGLAGLSASHVVLAGVLLMLQVVILSHRWATILAAMNIPSSPWRAFRIFEIGMFFNQALPSSIGGDGVRIWFVRGPRVGLRRAFESVLIDRVSGIVGLVILMILGFPFLLALADSTAMALSVTFLMVATVAAIAIFFALDRLAPALGPLGRMRAIGALLEISRRARRLVWSTDQLLPVLGLAVAAHLLSPGTVYVVAQGMAVDLSLFQYLVLVPPVLLTILLPISIAGWGVREGAMVAALALVGVEPGQAVAISITLGLLLLAVSLPGGVFWLTRGPQPERE